MICTPTSTMPGLKGPKGDRGDPAPPPINGQCGTTNNNCTEGTLNDIADTSLHYQWQCTGQNGGSDSGTCQKAIPVNGVCDNTTRNSCTTGTPNNSAVSDTSSYYRWRCDGRSGGSNSGTCQKAIPVSSSSTPSTCVDTASNNYRCFSSCTGGWKTTTSARNCGSSSSLTCCWKRKSAGDGRCGSSTNSCTTGTFRDDTDDDDFYWWWCDGKNEGSNKVCYKRKPSTPTPTPSCTPTNAQCGSSKDSCTPGTFRDGTDTSSAYFWWCDGTCEGSNKVCYKTKPSTPTPSCTRTNGRCGRSKDYCRAGTFRDITDGTYSFFWSCDGTCRGSNDFCSKAIPSTPTPTVTRIDGKCSATKNRCIKGTFHDATDTSATYYWQCRGSGGGDWKSCSKAIPSTPTVTRIDGKCSATKNRCIKGTFHDATDTSATYYWQCRGSGGGDWKSCSKAIPSTPTPTVTRIDGKCSATKNRCIKGTFRDISDGTYSFFWSCDGKNGGSNDFCSKAIPSTPTPTVTRIDGKCSATKNRCIKGTFHDATDTSATYYWQCRGSGGGDWKSCSKAIPSTPTVTRIDGKCSATKNRCIKGTFHDATDTSATYYWQCRGSGGGDWKSCSKAIPSTPTPTVTRIDGKCSATKNRCIKGTFRDISDGTYSFFWSCDGKNGGSNDFCSKRKPTNGRCGSSKDSCTAGTFRDRPDSTRSETVNAGRGGLITRTITTAHNWSCDGKNGGSSQACSKRVQPSPPTGPGHSG